MKKLIKKYQQGGTVSYADTLMKYAKQNPDLFFNDSENTQNVRNWLRTNDREDILIEAYKNKGITDRTKMPLISSAYWQKHPVGGEKFMKETNRLSAIPIAAVGTVGAIPTVAATIGVTPYVVPTTLSGGIRFVADGALGTTGTAISNGIIKRNTDYNSWGEWLGAKTNRPDNAEVLEMTNPGGLFSIGSADWYTKGVLKRGAESTLRMGDEAMKILKNDKQTILHKIKPALNYTFNPFLKKDTAYKLGDNFKYSGNGGDSRPFKGDMVDLFLGKETKGIFPVETIDNSSVLTSQEIPLGARNYLNKRYPRKPLKLVKAGTVDTQQASKLLNSKLPKEIAKQYNLYNEGWGEVESLYDILKNNPNFLKEHPELLKTFQDNLYIESPNITTIDGKNVVDPGGYNIDSYSVAPNGDITYNFYDIWKFNAKDYLNRYKGSMETREWFDPETRKDKLKKVLYALGLKLIDEQGSPIVTTWSGKNTFSPDVFEYIIKPKYKQLPYKE